MWGFGSVNLFEGTYETKLNMAEMAAKLSGYEFFQDVDGDLVFKPPLYNLDTRPSRAYNIRPEDIISIGFTEKEPEATYITCRNGPFRNNRGIVDENEWGVKGQYVDYRLVGQFGFRPTSIETNYYNNPKSAFYAAVARLDIVNSSINGCSVTIPMRVELRPGYPVYIPHVDCYYYINSISHSFQFGGQCTTQLTLTARRRKFHGPRALEAGSKKGPERVDLSKTYRPAEILREVDTEGHPRIVGFPNVVMALDFNMINPLSFFVGSDADNLGRKVSIDKMINLLAEDLNYLSVNADRLTFLEDLKDKEGATAFRRGDILSKAALYRQGASYANVTRELARLQRLKARGQGGPGVTAEILRLEEDVGNLEDTRPGMGAAISWAQLSTLYDAVKKKYLTTMGLDEDYVKSSSGILELMGDIKPALHKVCMGIIDIFLPLILIKLCRVQKILTDLFRSLLLWIIDHPS